MSQIELTLEDITNADFSKRNYVSPNIKQLLSTSTSAHTIKSTQNLFLITRCLFSIPTYPRHLSNRFSEIINVNKELFVPCHDHYLVKDGVSH